MITKKTLMAAAFACAVTPVAYGQITYNTVNGGPNAINDANEPDMQVGGDVEVNGSLRVQPAPPVGPGEANNDNQGQTDPDIEDSGNPATSVVQTTLGSVVGEYDDVTGGGVLLETNGDATLSSSAGDNVEVEARRVTRFQVYNADQPQAGQPVMGSQFYYLTDGEGNVLDLTTMQGGITPNGDGGFDSEDDMDDWVAAAPLDDPGYDDVSETTPLPDNGGNLQVGGDANVDGVTTLNGLTNTGDTELNGDIVLNGDVAVDGVLAVDTITDTSGKGLIRRDGDGSIHIGEDSFILDDTVANHVLTTNGGTKLVLGGDAPATGAVESVNIEVANNLDVMGNTDLNGDLNVDGDTTLDDTTVDGTLDVSGLSSLDGGINVNDNFTVAANGNTDIDGNLDVDGFTTTDGIDNAGQIETDTLLVNGNSDLNGNLDVDGFTNTDGIDNTGEIETDTLLVNGNSDLNGNLDVNGFTNTDGLRNDGTLTNNGNVNINGNTDISGVLSLGNTGHGSVDDVARRINNNSNSISSNKDDIRTNRRGIAMVAAMTNTTVLPGNTSAVDFNLSNFDGATGFGFGYAHAVNSCLQLKVAVASTTDFDEAVIRAGVSYQW